MARLHLEVYPIVTIMLQVHSYTILESAVIVSAIFLRNDRETVIAGDNPVTDVYRKHLSAIGTMLSFVPAVHSLIYSSFAGGTNRLEGFIWN